MSITPCLWFDGDAEEAANFYVSVFPNSKITAVSRATGAGPEQAGAVQTVLSTYDGVDNKTSCTYPGGRIIARRYDELDRASVILEGTNSPLAMNWFIGQRLEQRGRDAGPVGHGYDGDLRLADIGDDAGDDRIFHVGLL